VSGLSIILEGAGQGQVEHTGPRAPQVRGAKVIIKTYNINLLSVMTDIKYQ
jgi:hypothetical protein